MTDHDLDPAAYKTISNGTDVVLEPALAKMYHGDLEPLVNVSDLKEHMQALKNKGHPKKAWQHLIKELDELEAKHQ